MRQRKRIAVLGATEMEAGALAIVLEANGYAVEICMSEKAAMELATPSVFVVLGLSNSQRERVESRLRLQHRNSRMVMASHEANTVSWVAQLLPRIAMAAARRRAKVPKHATAKRSAAGEQKRAERLRRLSRVRKLPLRRVRGGRRRKLRG